MTYTAMMRFKDALTGNPRDRVPVLPLIGAIHFASYFQESPDEIRQSPKKYAEVMIRARKEFDLDFLRIAAMGPGAPLAFGCRMRPGIDRGMPIINPLPFDFHTLADVDQLPHPDPEKDGSFPMIHETARRLSDYAKGEVPVLAGFDGPFTTIGRLLDTDKALRMVMKRRDVFEAIIDRVNRFLILLGNLLVQNGVDGLFIPEPTASSTMISPKLFRDIVLPRLQELIASVKVPTILHICGETSTILKMMAETGATVLSLDQCMDLKAAREKVPEAVIGGNVDPIGSLLFGSPDRVAENTLECLRAAGTERYILMSGCGIPFEAPLENLKTMHQTVCDYGLGDKSN